LTAKSQAQSDYVKTEKHSDAFRNLSLKQTENDSDDPISNRNKGYAWSSFMWLQILVSPTDALIIICAGATAKRRDIMIFLALS